MDLYVSYVYIYVLPFTHISVHLRIHTYVKQNKELPETGQ